MFKSKKGEDEVLWIIRILLIYTAVGLVIFFSVSIRQTLLSTDDTLFYPLAERILMSPGCFSEEDADIGKAFSGTWDYSKFTQQRFNQCFEAQEAKLCAKVTLNTAGESLAVYHNKDLYEEYKAIDIVSPNVEVKEKRFPVMVRKGDSLISGFAVIEIGWYQS